MAVFTLTDAYLEVNSVDLSDHVTSVTIDTGADEIDTTAMGSDGWKTNIGGLKNWSLQVNFHQDFDASKVDATIWPLLGTQTSIAVRPSSASVSTTNPEYQGTVLVNAYSPVANGVGELSSVQVTWPGSAALVRATA